MYPIVSVLRRSAAHFIYVTTEMLVDVNGSAHVRLETQTAPLSLDNGQWRKPSKLVAVSELVATADTSAGAAISMTEKENFLAEKVGANKVLYTIIFGPEVEEVGVGVTRRCRLAVVRGVYRAVDGRLTSQPAQKPLRADFGKVPKGTIRL
jgi:hypothetical protein